MVSASVNTGQAGLLEIQAVEPGPTDAANNTSLVSWAAYLHERISWGQAWSGGLGATVSTNFGVIWDGTFAFDWRPAGLQSALIASGQFWTGARNPDGTGSIDFGVQMAATGTSGAGGPTYVGVTLPLVTLKVLPNTPTGLTATRISDTQVQLAWNQTHASNGAPTSVLVQQRINGGAWEDLVGGSPTTSMVVGTQANRKTEYRVRSGNAAGATAWSNVGGPVYTTPADPTNAAAAKDSANDINITFTSNVSYAEHNHEVWHGTVAGGVTTWDGAALATLASGVASYKHVAPNPAQVHIYRVRAKAGTLFSGYSTTSAVQVLAAPNKPTIPALPAAAQRDAVFRFPWQHNSVDSSPQTKYQWRWSTNGGAAWTTGAKTTSVNQFHDFAANTFALNSTVTFQVRTKGSYDSGGDGDASYSPWSDSVAVTFKSLPTTSIIAPANGSNLNDSTVRVTLGFAQAQAATFVTGQIQLLQGATLLEELNTNTLVGTALATPVQNGTSYTVRGRVQDSNGLWSDWATSTFNVVYLAPVPAGVVVTYLPAQGFGQIDLTIPAPGAGQSAATTVTITRSINGGPEEVLVKDFPTAAALSFLDTTPVIRGTNTYRVTTKSALGAQVTVSTDLVTTECRRAFLSKGAGFDNYVVFGANVQVNEGLNVASDTVSAAGRTKPIGLYGVETSVQLKASSFVYEGFGSTMMELRNFLLVPGKACYRDSTGRRVFGTLKGSVKYKKVDRGTLDFTLTETS